MTELFAQMDPTTLVPQLGFGGILIWVIVSWMKRLDASLENLNHSMKNLSKSIYLDLAERAAPGSFIRQEAKRMVERDQQRNEYGQDKMRP